MAKQTAWEALEERVRTIASFIWNAPARPELIHGVRCDAVLKLEPDEWVLLEVSHSDTLEKLRTDLAKFAVVKPALMAESIFAKCIFVCAAQPSDSLMQAAKGQNVVALSVDDLERQFFDYAQYYYVRNKKPFGSAVDPLSGEKDIVPYVPVTYTELDGARTYTLDQLRDLLANGRCVILLGNYGAGKSRCVQELFGGFQNVAREKHLYPVAIDLRDNWGLRRGTEIIRRHFDGLGLDALGISALKVIDKGSLILLLDGFDEIASQVWSDDPRRLEEIRTQSLAGVKDLIRTSRGGILVAGREHYFNSNDEMFRCLGFDKRQTIILRCADEFSDAQMEAYLSAVRPGLRVPKWLPRRPLVSKILAGLDQTEVSELLNEKGEIEFWHNLLDAICIREARIHTSLEPETIKSVLLELAQLSRTKANDVGPITLSEMNEAFERVVGRPPRDEASAMLQRLPVLGRLEAGSSDRQFLDTYILEGLRATALTALATGGDGWSNVLNEKWYCPLGYFGHSLLAQNIIITKCESFYLRLLKRAAGAPNRVLAGDILTALLLIEDVKFDFENLMLEDAHLGQVNFSETAISNLVLRNCVINELIVSPRGPMNVLVENSIIDTLRGLSRSDDVPSWLRNCGVENFDALTTVSKIKQANLSKEQQIFVTIVHKTFFQPGGGRKEAALLRGLGGTADQKASRRVLGILIEEGILDTFPGKEGSVYTPVRKHTQRLAKILSLLRHSADPLWTTLRND